MAASYTLHVYDSKETEVQKVTGVRCNKSNIILNTGEAAPVRWKMQTARVTKKHISGYQIQLATDRKFTKNKRTIKVKGYKSTSEKITKLKGGRKYFVRVRTYKLLNGKKYYSSWSKIRSIKTRK